jgi:hypothetical protein
MQVDLIFPMKGRIVASHFFQIDIGGYGHVVVDVSSRARDTVIRDKRDPPPMQWTSSGFSSALSISPRKSFHGEGSVALDASPGIGKLFQPHVREQIPVRRIGSA